MSFSVGKRPYQRSTRTVDEKTAKEIWKRLEAKIALGLWHPETLEHKKRTFDEMMERFMTEYAPTQSKNMQRSYRTSLAHLKIFFSGSTLNTIDSDLIIRYVAQRREQTCKPNSQRCKKCEQKPETDGCRALKEKRKCRPATRNRELSMLSKAFNQARLWKWTKENPCQLIPKEDEDNDIGYCLSGQEETRLLEACVGYCNGQLPAIVITALNTAMRKGEVLSMSWPRLNLTERIINTTNEKTDKKKVVPMNETVFNLLLEKSKVRSLSGYVFTTRGDKPLNPSYVNRYFKKACREIGLPTLRFHDLRHTAGTRLGRAGFDIHTIATILDHSQLSTTRRYVKLNVESMRKGVAALDNFSARKDVKK